jgi:predicted nucleotidyltransferase
MGNTETSILHSFLPNKARRRVLGLLFAHPDKSFYTKEIIKLAHTGTGAVLRELENLTKAGLISVEVLGNQKRYHAEKKSPIYSELRSIVLKTFGLADIIRDALGSVADEVHSAFIFGSIAKHLDTSTSDVDLMIITDTLSYADIFPLLEKPQATLAREINPTFYSQKEWTEKRKKKNNFIKKVMEQPKIFLIGTEDELNQLG